MPRGIPRQAKHNPVVIAPELNTADLPSGYTERVGPGVGEPRVVQVAERMPDPEKAAMDAFMGELVTIRIATSSDQNAEQVFEININGKSNLFRRGETKTVPRYFADHLARMKVTSYTQREVFNAEGIKQILNEPHTANKYDFAVVRDDNPMGDSWLRATMAMGA